MRGRPNKPKELKILEGTYRKDRDHGVLQFEKITEIPKPPTHLSRIGKQIWKEVTDILISVKILETIDIHTVAILCEELATYYEMTRKIKKVKSHTYRNGANNLVKRPEIAIRNQAMKNATTLMAQLGLTPSMRQKYGFTPDEEQEQTKKISIR